MMKTIIWRSFIDFQRVAELQSLNQFSTKISNDPGLNTLEWEKNNDRDSVFG